MDLVIIVILLMIVVLAFKTFSSFVYFTAIIDLFLRILTLIRYNIGIPDISNFIANYIPESIPAIFAKYSTGVFYTLLIWGYIVLMVIFLVYTIKIFMKKKWYMPKKYLYFCITIIFIMILGLLLLKEYSFILEGICVICLGVFLLLYYNKKIWLGGK